MKKSRLFLLLALFGVGCGGNRYTGCYYKPTPTTVMCWPMVPQMDPKGNYIPLFQMNMNDAPNVTSDGVDGTLSTGQDVKILTGNGSCVTVNGTTQLQPPPQPQPQHQPEPVQAPKAIGSDAGPKEK